MLRRIALPLNLIALIAAWALASQAWASTTITETQTEISISGLDAYPQITFILLTGLLILWVSKYLGSIFGKFLTSAVTFLLFATATPIWFESASGSLAILSPQISKLTGVSDWLGQSELIQDSQYDHLAADSFVIALIVWLVTLIYRLWSRPKGQAKTEFVTRIDKLPSW